MNNTGLIFSSLLVAAICTLISYEINRKFRIHSDAQKKSFGDLGKTEVVKTFASKWKPVITDATISWIMNDDPVWKAEVVQVANEKNITIHQSAKEAAEYLWNNNVQRMFGKDIAPWKNNWTSGVASGLKLNMKDEVLKGELSAIQNQPAV